MCTRYSNTVFQSVCNCHTHGLSAKYIANFFSGCSTYGILYCNILIMNIVVKFLWDHSEWVKWKSYALSNTFSDFQESFLPLEFLTDPLSQNIEQLNRNSI